MPYLRTKQDTLLLLLLSERLGSLSCTLSGDGKRRLFAIGNYFKQRLLYPFHSFLMSALRKLPMDGTFDQRAPIRRLRGSTGIISSIDLKSATDRWPLYALFDLTDVLFGEGFAACAVFSALGVNVFACPFLREREHRLTPISFRTGQPLGYLAAVHSITSCCGLEKARLTNNKDKDRTRFG
jgi:hypothetical protein